MTFDANIINYSPLPFYKSADEQNAKRWWIYDIYPLFASNKSLIPFQIIREHTQESEITPIMTHQEKGISVFGELEQTTAGDVWVFSAEQFPFGRITIRTSGNQGLYPNESDLLILCYDENGHTISGEYEEINTAWQNNQQVSCTYDLPEGTRIIFVFSEVDTQVLTTDMALAEIYSENGQYVGSFDLTIESGTDYDVIVGNPSNLNLPIGRYYIVVKDSFCEQWVSDILTVVDDDVLTNGNYVKLEWYDQQDLVTDSGIISYDNDYKNIVYLATDLAKPEYVYEEDGENRDGYFFPEKQISKKRYKFGFYAPEYLLDVLRLVRLADYAKVSYKGREYQCSEILLTPNWESQGDVALVEGEFDTNTVVKAVGRILS